MKLKIVRLLPVLFVIGLMSTAVNAAVKDTTKADDSAIMLNQKDIVWKEASKDLPPGTKIAVLKGTPDQPGPLTMRLKIPAGATLRPHTHPGDERFTVLSGKLSFGLGPKVDKHAKVFGPGSFFSIPAGDQMYAFTTDKETILELNVEGPWGINYLAG